MDFGLVFLPTDLSFQSCSLFWVNSKHLLGSSDGNVSPYVNGGGGQEKAMAPHSSTLAWKIPWMEEPGGVQSMGSLGIRQN